MAKGLALEQISLCQIGEGRREATPYHCWPFAGLAVLAHFCWNRRPASPLATGESRTCVGDVAA